MTTRSDPEAPSPHWLDSPRNIVLLVALQGAAGFAIGLAIWWGIGRAPGAFVGFGARDLLVGALTAAALILAMQAILLAFPRLLAWAADRQKMLFAHQKRYRPTHILAIALGAGIGEEALFRGGLQTFLAGHTTPAAAILLASLAFTILHWNAAGLLAFVFAYSLVFGAVYERTGSLAGVMLAHAAFDVWALAMVQRELVRQGFVRR